MTTLSKILVGVSATAAVLGIAFFVYRIVAAESSIYKMFGYFNH